MKVIYDEKFYTDMQENNLLSAQQVVPYVLDLMEGKVGSVVDVGCGRGLWLKAFHDAGVKDVFGVDGDWVQSEDLVVSEKSFSTKTLSEKFSLGKKADLAISLEVAEHLPKEAAEHFVSELTKAAPVILFSAAIPGQGGTDHLNEQWPDYWSDIFATHNFVPLDILRKKFWNNEHVAFFYAQNMLLFVDEKEISNYPNLLSAYKNDHTTVLRLVHPTLFTYKYEDAERWKLVVPFINRLPLGILKKIKSKLQTRKDKN